MAPCRLQQARPSQLPGELAFWADFQPVRLFSACVRTGVYPAEPVSQGGWQQAQAPQGIQEAGEGNVSSSSPRTAAALHI